MILRSGRVQLVQRGVERGRLARARRARHQNDPVRAADQALELPEVLVGEAQLPQADLDVVLVQHPHDDRLPVVGGDDAHPKVEFLLAHGDLDPAVLGAASLGDVQLGENLDAREDGAQQPSGGLSRSTSTPSIR